MLQRNLSSVGKSIQTILMRSYILSIVVVLSVSISWLHADDRPNILVILTDDMGFSDLGCFGGEIDTPHLDSLAKNGLRFTDFYNTSRCWPTRATLLSGVYSNGIKGAQVTIAELLKTVGYQTALAGKWHLGMDPTVDGPIQRGFDQFYGTMTGAGSFWDPMTLTRNTEFVSPDTADFYYTDKIGREAAIQIERFAEKRGQPFFQYVAFTAAHWPLHAPEASIQKYLDRYKDGWEALRRQRYQRMLAMGIIDEASWPLPELEPRVQAWETVDHQAWRIRNMAIYAAMVNHMDQAVGEIVSALKRTGQFENTLILYLHDNGACSEHLSGNGWNTANNVLEWAEKNGKTVKVGDHYDVPMGGPLTYGSVGHNWAHAQNTPLRRYKANVHEGGASTPAIAHWPRKLARPGEMTRQRGHVVDLMATCLELGRADYPTQMNGKAIRPHESISLVPVITGGQQARQHPYYFNHGGSHALIQGDWKIVREGKGSWALYNLLEDRTETKDLASLKANRVTQMARLWMKRYPAGK